MGSQIAKCRFAPFCPSGVILTDAAQNTLLFTLGNLKKFIFKNLAATGVPVRHSKRQIPPVFASFRSCLHLVSLKFF
ncbi:hypothetical protein [uncultured Fibrobacter sp.]|uniref:hypothetical protein n=1 Tax=uncultured Fibrobacter sp. TaxID=261512 RepID=UPI0025E8B024|nr:hypothetical protein [uncultured Fibrobacter sp.]